MEAGKLTVVADDGYLCAEAPVWEPSRGRIVWADIDANKVYQFMPGTRAKSVISQGLPVSGIALHKGGSLVFAGASGLHVWRGRRDYTTIVTESMGEKLVFNDILADPKGRVYAGTAYWGPGGMEKTGKLYLIDAGGNAMRMVDKDIELSNGMGLSPDHKTLYHADSAAHKIHAYEVDARTGMLFRKRLFVRVPTSEGIPDGLTVDAEGFVWCALWYGGQVVRYDPEGKVDRRIEVPAKQVSSLAFGGRELRDLYITTARQSWRSELMPPGYDPDGGHMGGAVYRVRLYVQGKIEHLASLA